MVCPKCHGQMQTYNRNGVQIEQCGTCRGIFLDYGELEALTQLEGRWTQPAPPPQSYPAPPAYPQQPAAPAWAAAPYGGGHQGGHHGGHHGGGHRGGHGFAHMLFSS
ncbi:zf-TFIIB domain-containing protein [Actinacidiphila sp. ITFR-21]|uniref:TFIIB-type zinc ribbon-containing protein n=1 Tax=Actinacidiphila sp. ITFR-21 TaxID=3075199 RepID=UPI00288A3FBA|nr:zf-TFIIB domain-containing protein [Streptomyces sp. ITFR-21]WNI14721.1 zf-TFIIB domain-containing protein [Streptomyces sp. ITFR-21]